MLNSTFDESSVGIDDEDAKIDSTSNYNQPEVQVIIISCHACAVSYNSVPPVFSMYFIFSLGSHFVNIYFFTN